MNDHIILDVETKHLATDAEVGGWANFHKCGVACAVVYEMSTQRFKIFGDSPTDLQALRHRLERSDRISGFNIRYFDFPVIYETPKNIPTPVDAKCDDLFERIMAERGYDISKGPTGMKGWGLDPVARGTLGTGKIDSGLHAPEMWRSRRLADLHTYCCDDVALERDLCAFIDQHGFVRNINDNQIVFVKPWKALLSSPR